MKDRDQAMKECDQTKKELETLKEEHSQCKAFWIALSYWIVLFVTFYIIPAVTEVQYS